MRPHRRLRAPARGFTLIELMVVVVIIAILATIAVPLFVGRIRQRAVQQTAGSMAEVFRGARTRALGRGAAIMVTVRDDGSFTVFEGVKGTTVATSDQAVQCGNLPTRGCTTNNWSNVGAGAVIGNARVIGGIAANTTDYTPSLKRELVTKTALHICFSPSGRTFFNESSSAPVAGVGWAPLTDVITVSLAADSHTYNVVLLPNGTARLGL